MASSSHFRVCRHDRGDNRVNALTHPDAFPKRSSVQLNSTPAPASMTPFFLNRDRRYIVRKKLHAACRTPLASLSHVRRCSSLPGCVGVLEGAQGGSFVARLDTRGEEKQKWQPPCEA